MDLETCAQKKNAVNLLQDVEIVDEAAIIWLIYPAKLSWYTVFRVCVA